MLRALSTDFEDNIVVAAGAALAGLAENVKVGILDVFCVVEIADVDSFVAISVLVGLLVLVNEKLKPETDEILEVASLAVVVTD